MSLVLISALLFTAAGPADDWQIFATPTPTPTAVAAADWQILEAPTTVGASGDWAILTHASICQCGKACVCDPCVGDCAMGYTRDVVDAALAAGKPLVVAVGLDPAKAAEARVKAADAGKLFCTAQADQGFAQGVHELTPRHGQLWIDRPTTTRMIRYGTSCRSCPGGVCPVEPLGDLLAVH